MAVTTGAQAAVCPPVDAGAGAAMGTGAKGMTAKAAAAPELEREGMTQAAGAAKGGAAKAGCRQGRRAGS